MRGAVLTFAAVAPRSRPTNIRRHPRVFRCVYYRGTCWVRNGSPGGHGRAAALGERDTIVHGAGSPVDPARPTLPSVVSATALIARIPPPPGRPAGTARAGLTQRRTLLWLVTDSLVTGTAPHGTGTTRPDCPYPVRVSLYHLTDAGELLAPTLIAAFDGWIDAGGAATSAAEQIAADGTIVATFDSDLLFDFRARRPTLEIVDGKLSELTWPELAVRRTRIGERDILVLSGAEPDFRWHEFTDAVIDLTRTLGVVEWISLGAIPAAVPHTRPVPIIGTASGPGLLRGDVHPGPDGLLRVPAAALSVLEMAMAKTDIAAVGYFAQVPHYVSGAYALAALALLRAVERHLGLEIPVGTLDAEAGQLRSRLDTATALEDTTRSYVERLEAMVDEERLPAGDELISEIERFLRDSGGGGTQRG